jgi:hypothetical protein
MGKVLEAIDAAIVNTQETGQRSHLGASSIGDKCARKLWYGFRWTTEARHPAQLLRLFNRGHLEEDRFVGWLRAAGADVWQNDPATGKQYRFTGYKGHFCGEIDGVGAGILEQPYLLEFKTHSDASFKSLVLNGVEIDKEMHYVQMQIYMGEFGLTQAVYLAINKNTDAIYDEVVPFKEKVYQKFVARAAMIVDAPEPPPRISRDASWYECKWCDHRAVCHTTVAPLINCRTCAHSTPVENAGWRCENTLALNNQLIPENTQLVGCAMYVRHPMD